LRLRRQAERAALALAPTGPSSGERVVPWIRPVLDSADQQRRLGEDLLFLPDGARLGEAANRLRQARRSYDGSAESAGVGRAALAVRDRALADLPAYSRWLAARPAAVDPIRGKDDEALVALAETLWDETHQLDAALAAPPDSAHLAERLETLRKRTEAAERR